MRDGEFMKIYTKTGDKGFSSLCSEERIKKSDIIFDVLGTLDELSSFIGLAKIQVEEGDDKSFLEAIQKSLICLMGDIATEGKCREKITDSHISALEGEIDKLQKKTGDVKEFSLPGENEISARLDIARAVARRAERYMVCASEKYDIGYRNLAYINRLSDYLYCLARLK